MSVKKANFVFGLVMLFCALLVPPAFLGGVVAGSAGLLMLTTVSVSSMPVALAQSMPPVIRVATVDHAMKDNMKVFELERGVVVFQHINGKLVSRFYRA